MSDREFLEKEIARWKHSPQRIIQIKGHLYYDNEHDILSRRRTMIGDGGELQEVKNLPNNRIIDNQYAKMVNQKANYLLGQPFVITGKNTRYIELLKEIFNKRFMKILKNGGKAALNGGIAWLYPYYTDDGKFSFRLFPGYEVLAFWKDSEHTILDFAVRLYLVEGYEGTTLKLIEKVEVYDLKGVHKFVLDGEMLVPDVSTNNELSDIPYVSVKNDDGTVIGINWQKIPLIPLKYNDQEIPLIKKVKTLQDGINVMLSDFENNMQEDSRNTILILTNYDGQDLGEFRRNLATFGAVKVRCDGETKGGVETLEITVNADNYKVILEIFKKALIENAMGYDAKDDRLSGSPNQMNIRSMYSDIDLDANDMEAELQDAFEEILWFVNVHLFNTGQGDFDEEKVDIIFNRDMLMDEEAIIDGIKNSEGILSNQTLVAQHRWVEDVEDELQKIDEEKQRAVEEMERQQYDPWRNKDNTAADEE
ncbi:MAG: phage portal protein [Lachnospiraceae bacterium]|nr:phage portal protein [Lachnospiraceae bacterium]